MTREPGYLARLGGALLLAVPVSLLSGALAAWAWARYPGPTARAMALLVVLLASSGAAVSGAARSHLDRAGLRALVGIGSGLAVLWGALLSGGTGLLDAASAGVATGLVLLVPAWRAAVTPPIPITRRTA